MIRLEGPNGIRVIQRGKPYFLQPGEKIVLSPQQSNDDLDARIGLGDAVAKLIATSGFKQYWQANYSEEDCKPCQERQAFLNYIKVKGPEWLKRWVETEKLKD